MKICQTHERQEKREQSAYEKAVFRDHPGRQRYRGKEFGSMTE